MNYNNDRWKATREMVLENSGYTCTYCGDSGEVMQVHHKEYFGNHPSDTPDKHLVSVCEPCHDDIHWHERLRARAKYINKMGKNGAALLPEEAEKLNARFDV